MDDLGQPRCKSRQVGSPMSPGTGRQKTVTNRDKQHHTSQESRNAVRPSRQFRLGVGSDLTSPAQFQVAEH